MEVTLKSTTYVLLFLSSTSLCSACSDNGNNTSGDPPSTGGSGGTGGTGGTGGDGGSGATGGMGGEGGMGGGGGAGGGMGGAGGGMGGGGSAPSVSIYAPDDVVAGKNLAQWGAAWWEWALSIPKSTNPMLEGACDQNQPNEVFFLAGNSTGGQSIRSCTVPAGKPLFFPIVNIIYRMRPEVTCSSTENSIAYSAQNCWSLYQPTPLLLEIDGVSMGNLDAYGLYTGLFHDTQPADPAEQVFAPPAGPVGANSCGIPEGSPRPAAGNGFWMAVKPLPPGNHTVRFAGGIQIANAPDFSLDVTYNLTVTP